MFSFLSRRQATVPSVEAPTEPAYGSPEYKALRRTQLREQYSTIAERDRGGLYALADMALRSSIERPYDLLVVDAVSGMLVGKFLRAVIAADARKRGLPQPEYIQVANSRRVAADNKEHQAAVVERLAKRCSQGNGTLLITDTVETGGSIVRLKEMAAASGISDPRYAILLSYPDLTTLSQHLGARETDIFSNQGNEPAGVIDQAVKRHIGFHSVAGQAEPVPYTSVEYHGPSESMMNSVYENMANDYIASHINNTSSPNA